MDDKNKSQLIYILPNFFTAVSAFLGVVSIISSLNGNYGKAIFYIFLSLIFDGLDGRVARLTKTTSKFGVEFDSLADIIAFGVAPAVFFYTVLGQEFGKFGVLVCGLFVVFGAIRLARFNVTTGTYEPSVFIGLPIPTAAVVSAVYTYTYLQYDFLHDFKFIFLLLQLCLGLLMVSNIRYPSFKKLDLSKANMLRVLILLILVFSLFYLYTLESALCLMSAYVLYGIIRAIWTFTKTRKRNKA